MTPGLYALLAVGVVLAIVVALIGWQRYDRRRIDLQFRLLAKDTELRLTIPKSSLFGLFRGLPRLDGKIAGFDVSLECYVAGHEEFNRSELLLRFTVPSPRQFAMIICRRRQLGIRRIAEDLKSWESGDPALDDRFSLWTNDGDKMAAVFDESTRAVVCDQWPSVRVCSLLKQGALTFHISGLLRTAEKRAAVGRCITIASHLASHLAASRAATAP